MMRRLLFLVLPAALGCGPVSHEAMTVESAAATLTVSPSASPSAPAPEPPSTAAASSPPPTPDPPTKPLAEAETPSLGCADVSPGSFRPPDGHASGARLPRACVVRGRITGVRRVEALAHGENSEVLAALLVELDPADDASCVTPLDEAAGKLAEPEVRYADKVTATKIELVGASRLLPELRVGRRLCGWIKGGRHRPVYGPPNRWEGQIADADGTLLLAAATYLDLSASKTLAGRFRFAREGTPTRHRIDEGGAFVLHPAVRVTHGGRSVVVGGGEQLLPLPDGSHLAIRARSELTEGHVPVFTGKWDGYRFSAMRVP